MYLLYITYDLGFSLKEKKSKWPFPPFLQRPLEKFGLIFIPQHTVFIIPTTLCYISNHHVSSFSYLFRPRPHFLPLSSSDGVLVGFVFEVFHSRIYIFAIFIFSPIFNFIFIFKQRILMVEPPCIWWLINVWISSKLALALYLQISRLRFSLSLHVIFGLQQVFY